MTSNHISWIVFFATFIPASRGFTLSRWSKFHERSQLLVCAGSNHHRYEGEVAYSINNRQSRAVLLVLNSDSDDYSYYDEESSNGSPGSGSRQRRRPIRISNHNAKAAEMIQKEAQARHEQALKDPTLLTNVKFQEREDIHPSTKRALAEVMGLQSMTEIQSKTYAEGTQKN